MTNEIQTTLGAAVAKANCGSPGCRSCIGHPWICVLSCVVWLPVEWRLHEIHNIHAMSVSWAKLLNVSLQCSVVKCCDSSSKWVFVYLVLSFKFCTWASAAAFHAQNKCLHLAQLILPTEQEKLKLLRKALNQKLLRFEKPTHPHLGGSDVCIITFFYIYMLSTAKPPKRFKIKVAWDAAQMNQWHQHD